MQQVYDVVVVGSGAAAFLAAIRSATLGAKVIMLEKGSMFGGTSAKSGGGIWIPNNPNITQAGVSDSADKAFGYMRSVIPDELVKDSALKNYIANAAKMLQFLEEHTPIRYAPVEGYADYYPDVNGWLPGGRTMDPSPIDGRPMGNMLYKMVEAPRASKAMGLFSMSILEGMQILAATPGWQTTMAKIIWGYLSDITGRIKNKRDRRLAQGNALIGGLYYTAKDLGVELLLETPVTDLVKERGRICGVEIERNGEKQILVTKRGVIIAAGGFEQNPAMRKKYLPSPTDCSWSAGVETNTGDLINIAMEHGVMTRLMNEAWWAPVVKTPDGPTVLFSEKSKPGLVVVDKNGKRFMNESITYNSYGDCFYNAKLQGYDCFPAYVIFDSRYRSNYIFGGMPQANVSPDWMNRDMVGKSGVLTKANSLEELAGKLGINSEGLRATADKMAIFSKAGVDEDFGRGSDDHDRMYGDMEVKPNPCLGALGKSPFYGAEIFPGDIGTKGGIVINSNAQALDRNGDPISGLYAAGNCTASIMGNKYPGAGCTLGPAMTMAFLAANHVNGTLDLANNNSVDLTTDNTDCCNDYYANN